MTVSGLAQEQLKPLSRNFNLSKPVENKTLNKSTTLAPIDLPFFDDFSYAYKNPYPSASNWIDSNVYVNMTFAIAPITMGVATFDGLNKKGYPYSINAPVNYSGPSDYLTSRPINLHSTATHTYSPADSIYISFYYQAAGNGDWPEPNDSLCLDFFKARQGPNGTWKKVWGIKGYHPNAVDTNFRRVRIAIADTAYCDSLFKFRFRNKATANGSNDHWHIDYVQVKQNYFINDTILDDVSYAYRSTSFLKNYYAMPYRQYNEALERAPGFHNFFRSNFNVPKFSVYDYTVTTQAGTPIPSDPYGTFATGIDPYSPSQNQGYYTGNAANPVFTYSGSLLPSSLTDSTYFTIKHVISTSGDLYKSNDTLIHIQNFKNYYAYDDGSAEVGYYLNTYGAKTAVRFTLNTFDTLKSVRIFFDPIINGTATLASSFRIVIWGAGGNGPGSIIYKDSLMYPQYIAGDYYTIPTYSLTSCLPLSVGTYYIGVQQTTNQSLNIGFDRNTDHRDALYYDVTGSWNQSTIRGSLMINPVMGCTYPLFVGIKELEQNNKLTIFPNPAQNSVSISYPGNQLVIGAVEIFTSLGQLVYTKKITSNESLDISDLPNGLYFIHLKGSDLNVSSQKLIISR